jgi:hypothetical protein
MVIGYHPPKGLPIQSVKLLWKHKSTYEKLIKDEHSFWSIELDLPKGEYFYRFLINDTVYLSDPCANYYSYDGDTRWSALLLMGNGTISNHRLPLSVEIENYVIGNHVTCYGDPTIRKNIFNTLMDSMISIRYDFTHIIGAHTVTLLWVNPLGEIFCVSENRLEEKDTENGAKISLWFHLDLKNSNFNYPLGLWKVLLLINGGFVMEDYFQLTQFSLYTPNGTMLINNRYL